MQENVYFSVIVPVYNEQEVVTEFYKRIKRVMDSTKESYELLFVNDGSRDKTLEKLIDLCKSDKSIKIIDFSRNFGHQIAISAGMDFARGNAIVVIDADLQDPPNIILKMIVKWKQGYDVVYGKRTQRKKESLFKRFFAAAFYRFLRRITGEKIPVDVGDFRLIDRKVCDSMKNLHEKHRFVRGLISWLGFNQTEVTYIREKRFAGKTKYPLRKVIGFALDAITSFSHKPLKIATFLGFFILMSGFVYLFYILYQRLFTNNTVEGWTSIISLTLVFNGITLFILGIIGEYIGRIYDEAKGRPLYIIKDWIGFTENKESERQ